MAATVKVEESAALDLGCLLDAGDGAMVTLVAGQTQLAAHRALLHARSPALAAILGSGSCCVSIPDVEGTVLRQLVAYLYTLRPPHLPAVDPHLLTAADRYGVSGLKAHCEQQLVAELSVENAAAAAVLAVRHSCPSLQEAAVAFIRAHPQVMATQGWADAVLTQPQHVVELSRLLAEPQAGASAPPTQKRSCPPGADRQPHRGARHQPPATPARPAPTLDYNAVRSMGCLSGEERCRQIILSGKLNNIAELRALMALGVDLEAIDGFGRTALHWAVLKQHEEAARCLVEAGALVNAGDSGQETPLHVAVAVARGGPVLVRLLLAAGADCNARNHWGRTPLHWAACSGNIQTAAALLEAGADRCATDKTGRTPLDYARPNGQQQLVEMLTPH